MNQVYLLQELEIDLKVIRDYLLENTGLVESLSDSCLFVSTGTETCYTGSVS